MLRLHGCDRTPASFPWVNQIDGYNAHFLLLQDPRELASWVNQIES